MLLSLILVLIYLQELLSGIDYTQVLVEKSGNLQAQLFDQPMIC